MNFDATALTQFLESFSLSRINFDAYRPFASKLMLPKVMEPQD
jgi:hypothetical protein